MTLLEMKKKVLRLIEEISPNHPLLTEDVDIEEKLNDVINQIMFELIRIKKIPAYETLEVKENEEIELNKELKNFFQLDSIKDIEYESFGNIIIPKEDGIARIFYYKFPKKITKETDDSYKFEVSDEVLEIMPYGIAADLLKSDVSSQYGSIYANRYNELKQGLDPRYNTGSITIEGGVDF